MQISKAAVLLPLTLMSFLLCHGNQYDNLTSLILKSDFAHLQAALEECKLTQSETTSLKKTADDICIKRLKKLEKWQSAKHKMSWKNKFKLFGSLISLQSVGISMKGLDDKSSELFVKNRTAVGFLALACAATSVFLFINAIRSHNAYCKEKKRKHEKLYMDSIKIRTLIFELE